MPISPNQGSTGGGTPVTITGTNLTGTTAVHFGTKPATAVTNVSPTQVTAVSPSGTGTVGVTVTTPGGTSNPISFFYVGAPFKSSLTPGLRCHRGRRHGHHQRHRPVDRDRGELRCRLGDADRVNDGQLTVTVPAGAAAGPVGVSVTTAGGTNNGLTYTYVDAPTVTTLTPDSGPTSGGTAVTIAGTGFTTTQSVTFDAVPAPFSVIDDSTLSVVTRPPGGTPGAVDVTVTTTGGSAVDAAGFTYIAGPGI